MDHPRIGFSTMVGSAALADLPEHLDLIQSLEVEVAELSALHDDLIACHRLIPTRLALLKSILANRPLQYSLHAAVGLNFMVSPCDVSTHEDVAKAYLELAAEVGAQHVVVHTGMYPGHLTQVERDRRYAQQRACLARLGQIAAAQGAYLCVENVFYWNDEQTATPQELAQELATLDHPHVCATFDFAHGALNLEDLGGLFLHEAAALAPHARHLHLHDNFGRRHRARAYTPSEELAFGEGDLHLPLHWGGLPWDQLARLSYPQDPVFMIELAPRFWHEAAQMVSDTRAWAQQIGP